VGIPEVGSRWEFLGIPCLKVALSRDSLEIPNTGGVALLQRGFLFIGGVVFTGSIFFIAPPVTTSSFRAQEK